MRPATNEEASGSEMVRNWIPELSEDVRRARLLHHTAVTQAGEPEEDEGKGAKESIPDVRHGRPEVQPEPERPGKPEGSVVEPSHQSLTVPEPDLEGTSRGERLGRA